MTKTMCTHLARSGFSFLVVLSFAIIASGVMARGQSLQEQGVCAKQAQRTFQEDWQKPQLPANFTTVSQNYQSHFNTKLRKCLVLIECTLSEGKELITSAQLMDAYERRMYASYFRTSNQSEEFWQVITSNCEITPSFHEKTHCTSREEFDAFVAKYMEE
jgi:hypothetical protein